MSTIEFYFDFVSPYAYLASLELPKIAAKHGWWKCVRTLCSGLCSGLDLEARAQTRGQRRRRATLQPA